MINSNDRSGLEILTALAGISFVLGHWIRRIEQAGRHWPRSSGRIVTSGTGRKCVGSYAFGQSRHEVLPVIEYEFSHEGRLYKTSHWRRFNFSIGNSVSAEAVTSRYPAGQSVTVFVNPRDPMYSVLECQPSCFSWVLFGLGIFFMAAAAFVLFSIMFLQK